MALADLLVRIGVDTAAFSSGLERFNKEIGTSAKNAEKSFGNIARAGDSLQSIGVGLTAALTLPIAGFATAATAAFAEIDSLKRGLFTLEKSAQGTERRFRELQQVAALPGLGLEEAVRGDIRLRAIGLSSETSKRALLAFGNALASVGSGKADLDETIRQFGQLATASTLTAENLKPIIERVPQAAQILRTAFGTANAEQLRDLGVTSAQVVNTLISELEKLPPVTGGIKNALENFSDSSKIALASAGEAFAPFVEKALSGLSSLIGEIPRLAKAFQALPEPAQFAAAAIAAVAFVGPLAIVALSTLISSFTAIATAFSVIKTSAAFAAVVSALGTAIASVGSVAAVTAAAMGALSLALGPGAWLALAAAVGVAGNEILKYREAVNLGKSLEEQQARGQAVLIISLRQAGVAVDELIRQKNAGIITEKQYQQAIRDAAIALGNQRRAAAEAASGATSVASANDLAKQKFLELGKQVEAGKLSADAFFATFQKASGLDKAKLSAEGFKLKISELDAKLAAGKITTVEYALAVDALRQSHTKAAVSVEAHNAAYSGFKRVTEESQILLAQQNILLGEQRKNIDDIAAARLKLARGQVSIDFGELPQIETKIKISEIDVPPFDELDDLNRTISSIDLNDRITKAAQIERNKRTEASIKRLGEAYKTTGNVSSRAMKEVSTVLTNLSQGIGQAIFSGEKFGAVFVRIGKQIGASITSFIIQELIRATGILDGFERTLKGVIRNLTGQATDQIVNQGVNAGVNAGVGAVGSVAGGSAGGAAASTAGQVAGAAASAGVTAIVGAVSGVVSAISGVFGNFQMAAMNKVLDLIEVETRKTANDLANLRADEFVRRNELFTKLDDLFQFTWVKFDELITSTREIRSFPIDAAVVGGGTTNNFVLSSMVPPTDTAAWFDWFASELRRRRIIS